jgi:predicted HTH domain antitoxin
MCNLSSAFEREGIEKGRAEGKFEIMVKFFRDGIISAGYAASNLGMTEAEFLEKAGHFEEGKSDVE